jgi:hypothetical protein
VNNLDNTAYYPFTLSIRNPEALYRFYEGTLSITIAFYWDAIAQELQAEGLTLRWNSCQNGWVFEVAPIQENDPRFRRIRIGHHLFQRTYAEFLSFHWFFEQLIRLVSNSSLFNGYFDAQVT